MTEEIEKQNRALKVGVKDWIGFIVLPFFVVWLSVTTCGVLGVDKLIGAGGGVGFVVILGFIELRTIVLGRINAIEERFDYDWTLMSAELLISAYKRGGGLLCRAEKRFCALATAINMPFTGDWLIFEGGGGKTYRGEVMGREIRYGEETSIPSPNTEGTRLHMIVRIDVVCDDEEGWPPSPELAMDHYPVTPSNGRRW